MSVTTIVYMSEKNNSRSTARLESSGNTIRSVGTVAVYLAIIDVDISIIYVYAGVYVVFQRKRKHSTNKSENRGSGLNSDADIFPAYVLLSNGLRCASVPVTCNFFSTAIHSSHR